MHVRSQLLKRGKKCSSCTKTRGSAEGCTDTSKANGSSIWQWITPYASSIASLVFDRFVERQKEKREKSVAIIKEEESRTGRTHIGWGGRKKKRNEFIYVHQI